jgi:hypothetical protein
LKKRRILVVNDQGLKISFAMATVDSYKVSELLKGSGNYRT